MVLDIPSISIYVFLHKIKTISSVIYCNYCLINSENILYIFCICIEMQELNICTCQKILIGKWIKEIKKCYSIIKRLFIYFCETRKYDLQDCKRLLRSIILLLIIFDIVPYAKDIALISLERCENATFSCTQIRKKCRMSGLSNGPK